MNNHGKRILVAVLSFNEARNIEKTLKDLSDHNCGFDIVVIDDGSNDKTAAICKALAIPVVSHCVNAGNYSNAAMTYFLYAFRNDYDVLCQFDGDGQHIASELPKILEPVCAGEADVMIGSRFLDRVGFQSYFFRRIGIRTFSVIDSYIIGNKLTDVTSGFRSYNKKVITFFGHVYKQELYDNTSQFLLLTHFIGGKIRETAIRMRPREHGTSVFNLWKSVTFPLKGIFIVLGCLVQRNLIANKSKNYEF